VSFQAPLVLLALLVLPVLAAMYIAEQRRRRRVAAAFALERVQPSVAPRRPRWRRHLPVLALALAVAILIGAAARPQRTVAVPVEQASIMLATDVSGSMTSTDVTPTRLVAAKRAARAFLLRVPARVKVGVLAFNQTPRVLANPTTDREAVLNAIARMGPSGGTASGEAIATATTVLNATSGRAKRKPPAAIVLLSDGASTSGRDPVAAARAAGRAHIPVYTVALGTAEGTITVPAPGGRGGTVTKRVPPDPESLKRIADASGASSFTAQTADGLSEVYKRLGSQLSHKLEKRQVTQAFAGGALVLIALGGVMSLRWFGRLA
jgi:Ca-activated chloride channel family protein